MERLSYSKMLRFLEDIQESELNAQLERRFLCKQRAPLIAAVNHGALFQRNQSLIIEPREADNQNVSAEVVDALTTNQDYRESRLLLGEHALCSLFCLASEISYASIRVVHRRKKLNPAVVCSTGKFQVL